MASSYNELYPKFDPSTVDPSTTTPGDALHALVTPDPRWEGISLGNYPSAWFSPQYNTEKEMNLFDPLWGAGSGVNPVNAATGGRILGSLPSVQEQMGRVDPLPGTTQYTGGGQTDGSPYGQPIDGGQGDAQGGGFNIDPNVFPWSGSFTGLNYNSPISQAILPPFLQSAVGLPGLAAGIGDIIQDRYKNMMNQALGPEAFQGTLNSLNNRRMLNSTVASDAMSRTASNIAKQIGDKAYQSQLAAEQARMQVPGILGQLMELNRESASRSEQPNVPYDQMIRILLSQQGL